MSSLCVLQDDEFGRFQFLDVERVRRRTHLPHAREASSQPSDCTDHALPRRVARAQPLEYITSSVAVCVASITAVLTSGSVGSLVVCLSASHWSLRRRRKSGPDSQLAFYSLPIVGREFPRRQVRGVVHSWHMPPFFDCGQVMYG